MLMQYNNLGKIKITWMFFGLIWSKMGVVFSLWSSLSVSKIWTKFHWHLFLPDFYIFCYCLWTSFSFLYCHFLVEQPPSCPWPSFNLFSHLWHNSCSWICSNKVSTVNSSASGTWFFWHNNFFLSRLQKIRCPIRSRYLSGIQTV